MSLAVLARKTKTKQRLKSSTCGNGRSRNGQQGRSVGFVLNMTGRGGGIGLSGMSYKQRGASCTYKQRGASCTYKQPKLVHQTNTMLVGSGVDLNGTFFGFETSISVSGQIGSFTPPTINGVGFILPSIADWGIKYYPTLQQSSGIGLFQVVGVPGRQTQTGLFTSISFVDGCNVRTYRSSDADFDSDADANSWGWTSAASGYSADEEMAYWSGNNGKSLAVYVTDSTNNTIFPTPENLCPTPENLCPSQCCSGNCKTGQAGTCCKADKIVSQERRANCGECWYGGMSQPAPQMSYRNYINRKASGAYRPGGGPCCVPKCLKTKYGEVCNKNPNTWKQHPNISASTITEHRRQSTIRCANGLIKRNPVYLGETLISNRINAKPVCSWYNPVTCQYETIKGANPLTQSAQCTKTLPIKSRLGYTRINKNWCNTTKSLTVNNSASDQIAKRKQKAFLCKCKSDVVDCKQGPDATGCKNCKNSVECDNQKRRKNRYCYPRPMATGKCRGSLTLFTKQKVACLRKAQCNK